MTETTTTDATPAAAPQVNIDPVWTVVTDHTTIQVRATDVLANEDEDAVAVTFYHDDAKTEENDSGLVAIVPWAVITCVGDDRFVTVVDPPSKVSDVTAG